MNYILDVKNNFNNPLEKKQLYFSNKENFMSFGNSMKVFLQQGNIEVFLHN